jgi:hypothetical protein
VRDLCAHCCVDCVLHAPPPALGPSVQREWHWGRGDPFGGGGCRG